MLDQIMNLVKGQVSDAIGGMKGIPEEKKEAAVQTTAHSLLDGLKQNATPSGLSSLLGLGGGGGSAAGMSSGLEGGVVSALTSKVGLSPAIAQKIAATVIPLVMSLFKKKVDDPKEPGFNLESLLGVALELGGLVAGAAADEIKSLTAYGRHFGLAFQITDDLLDYLGDAENMGKRVRKDAGKNKLTYPGVFGLDAAWSDAAEEVRAACLALEPFKPTDQTPRNVRIAYDSLIAYARYLLGRKQ